MRYAGVLALLLLAGCSRHWSASYGPLVYPEQVGYGPDAEVPRGRGVTAPVLLLTDHDRARDCHPVVVAHGNREWLYFASDRDGDGFNIYRKELYSRAVERLTDLEGDEFWPRVSPDGRWLAFGGNARGHWDLYLLDLSDIGAPQLLTPAERRDCVHPAWSPDAATICFSAFSPTLDDWVIRGLTFGDGKADPGYSPTVRSSFREPVEAPPRRPENTATMAKEPAQAAALRSVASHWALTSAGGAPLTGLHPDFRPTRELHDALAFQDYRRDGSGWYSVKVFDFATGLTATLAPPRGYGAIQPRFMPDGKAIAYLTSAKAGARPESGDGFAVSDLGGNIVRDIRNPCGGGEISDPAPAVVGGNLRLLFGWADGRGESLCWITLEGVVQ